MVYITQLQREVGINRGEALDSDRSHPRDLALFSTDSVVFWGCPHFNLDLEGFPSKMITDLSCPS